MLTSIVIATHNEGDLLWKTVQSCYEACDGIELEIVVADDVSDDDSIEQLGQRFSDVKIHIQAERRGVSASKDLAARQSQGEVLLFLDGHCKPTPGAVAQMVEDIRQTEGQAIITPGIPALDPNLWHNQMHQVGHGYHTNVENFECRFIDLKDMQTRRLPDGRQLYESPSFIGCCIALTRELYEKLWGFDTDMLTWGTEDVDMALKAWLMGHPVLHDPQALIGHRFAASFNRYTVQWDHIYVNQLRMMRKNCTEPVWQQWIDKFKKRNDQADWDKIWNLFWQNIQSVDRERDYLFGERKYDEFWYAQRFGLDWPENPDKTET